MSLLACNTFCKSTSSDLSYWNKLIKNKLLKGSAEQAILTYINMQELGIHADNYSFPVLLKACSSLCSSSVGLMLHGQTIKAGFCGHVFVQTALLETYGSLRCIDDAYKVFDRMPEKDIVAWNSMLSFQDGQLPVRYLGVPVVTSMSPTGSFRPHFYASLLGFGFRSPESYYEGYGTKGESLPLSCYMTKPPGSLPKYSIFKGISWRGVQKAYNRSTKVVPLDYGGCCRGRMSSGVVPKLDSAFLKFGLLTVWDFLCKFLNGRLLDSDGMLERSGRPSLLGRSW
ncbi:hypothetical protein Patl1_12598 [Pistacia atlantica]|uniref:Uncharacterized protein n=1 Tax=Pistacia atlantica TaxID=434234 RepID=A0ACC1AVZ9_9ROSI|nr:hypothetical protein Patl1_12598 [Pistacia atlantica]